MNKESDSKNSLLKRQMSDSVYLESQNKRIKMEKDESITKIEKSSSTTHEFLTSQFVEKKLLIPNHFKFILDSFVTLDMAVNKLINNRESLYYERIVQVLEEMNTNKFNKEVFGQILTIFPESYFYEIDKAPMKAIRTCEGRLKIMPNISYGQTTDSSPRKSNKCLSLGQLLFRKNSLHKRLLNIVKEAHDKFLTDIIKIPKTSIKSDINRWHPAFDIEYGVEKIQSKILDNSVLGAHNSGQKKISKFHFTKPLAESGICRNLFNNTQNTVTEARDAKPEPKIIDEMNDSVKEEQPTGKIDITTPTKDNRSKRNLIQSTLAFPLRNTQVDQNQNKISPDSPYNKDEYSQKQKLPLHLKNLFELFLGLDKAVRDVYCRGELCYLSRISRIVSMKINFSEEHMGKIIAIYPEAYSLKWERMLTVNSKKPSKRYDIVIRPNLRIDGTRSALLSPDKGFLVFDFSRLKERRKTFLDKCTDIVVDSYRKFLSTILVIPNDQIDNFIKKEHWKPEFDVNTHVKLVEPLPMPVRPEEKEYEKELVSFNQFFTLAKKRKSEKIHKKVNENCTFMHPSLLEKVRQSKAKPPTSSGTSSISITKKLIISKLPEFATVLDNEFKLQSFRPLEKSHLKNLTCRSLGIQENSFDEIMAVFIDLVPEWIRVHQWGEPYYSIDKSQMNFSDVKTKLSQMIIDLRCQELRDTFLLS